MRIYVASSWRNARQPYVVEALRAAGHEVYDFRNPAPGDHGFSWSAISASWLGWTAREFNDALEHPVAKRGFGFDMDALKVCEACLLLQPCGRSAHLELGYAVGAGKLTIALLADHCEPELMYRMVDHRCLTMAEVLSVLAKRGEVAA